MTKTLRTLTIIDPKTTNMLQNTWTELWNNAGFDLECLESYFNEFKIISSSADIKNDLFTDDHFYDMGDDSDVDEHPCDWNDMDNFCYDSYDSYYSNDNKLYGDYDDWEDYYDSIYN